MGKQHLPVSLNVDGDTAEIPIFASPTRASTPLPAHCFLPFLQLNFFFYSNGRVGLATGALYCTGPLPFSWVFLANGHMATGLPVV